MYGRNAPVYFRYGTFFTDGDCALETQVRQYADGKHHGLCAYDEHHAVRYVPVVVEPYRCIGNIGSHGCAHTDALCASDYGSMGSWRPGKGDEYAGTDQ